MYLPYQPIVELVFPSIVMAVNPLLDGGAAVAVLQEVPTVDDHHAVGN